MRNDAAQRELSRNNGDGFLAPGYACVPRVEWLRRYHDTVLLKGGARLVQGRRWVVVAWKSLREYDGGWCAPGAVFGRPGADQAPSSPGALDGLNGGRTRYLVPAGPRSQRAHRGIKRDVDDSRGAAVAS